eukprot:gene30366-36690_t
MVVIQVKGSEDNTFLYETTCDTSNDDLVRDLVRIWNLRIRLAQLAGGIRELAKYGPMKHPDKAGIDEIQERYNGETIDKGEFYQADPAGIRTGNGVGPQLTETIERVACEVEAILDKSNVARRVSITLAALKEKLDLVRGAVTMAYPMGLPDYDTVRLSIEGEEGLQGTAAGQELLVEDTAELWVASRIFDRTKGQTVADRLGRNEKTKVVGKLQRPGGGPPGREPGVSEEEKKAMMAYYFKKQEEYKKMAENSEDDYLHSSWADPKQLQKSLRGQGDIRAPGVRKL